MSLTLESGACGCDGATLSLNLTLTNPCCPAVPAAVVAASATGEKDLIRITSADFASATEWEGTNTEGVTIIAANSFKVFDNNINRYLDEGTEWQRTATGIEFLISGFDSTANSYTLYIHIN